MTAGHLSTSDEPEAPTTRWSLRVARAVGLVALAVIGVLGLRMLYLVDPTTSNAYPSCAFFALTGWHCPGCGTGRSMHALVHGDLAQAWAWNPLMLIIGALLVAHVILRALDVRFAPRHLANLSWALCWLVIGYWLLRNVPLAPFSYLAPRALPR